MVVIFLAVQLLRLNLPAGTALVGGFLAFVFFKEFWWDATTSCFQGICGYGQSFNGASVDATFYWLGGLVGAVTGALFPHPWAIGATAASVTVVGVLLFAGVI